MIPKKAAKLSKAYSVTCPKCKAIGGTPCRKASGSIAELHTERLDAYNKKQLK